MSLYTNVKIALDTRLSQCGIDVPIIYDGVNFKPTKNQPYMLSTIIHAPAVSISLQTDQTNIGIYQVSVFSPSGGGSRELLDMMSDLYTHFKDEVTLQYSNTTVYLRQISLSPLVVDGIWVTANLSVSFNYYSN